MRSVLGLVLLLGVVTTTTAQTLPFTESFDGPVVADGATQQYGAVSNSDILNPTVAFTNQDGANVLAVQDTTQPISVGVNFENTVIIDVTCNVAADSGVSFLKSCSLTHSMHHCLLTTSHNLLAHLRSCGATVQGTFHLACTP
eukprot:m.275869 g.275869  ORF g.275869 m.275869 type:complete len:143 (-) comp15701_c0_seq3:210-638(-)